MRARSALSTAVAVIPTALFVSACGGGETAAKLDATVDTVGGVVHIAYPAEPAGPMGWSADTVAVLGDAFAEDAYQFDGVIMGGLAADADGNLYVLDRQGHRVLKYGPDGGHLATFGREGEGPGELNQPVALAVGPHDTVWVADFSNLRFTGYPQDGGDPRTVGFSEDFGLPGQRLTVLDDGFVTTFRQLFFFRRGAGGGMDMSRGDDGEGDTRTVPIIRLDPALQPLDTLWASPEAPMDMVQLEAGNNVMITMMSRTFWPEFQWGAFPDGSVAIADSVAYAIRIVGLDGGTARMITRAPPPRPVTEADRELARERVREESQGGGIRIGGRGPSDEMQEELLRQRLEKMTFADLVPRVVALRVDPAGRLWVGVSEDTPDEVDRIDVYDRDGTLLGELRDFPFPDVFIGTDRIGVLRRDELDVQQVVVLEIDRSETEVATS